MSAAENSEQVKEFWRAFLDAAPAGVAVFDRDMRYLEASARWMRDYGLDGQDLGGRSHYEIFPDIPERWREIHRRCLAGTTERCEADPFPRADGTIDWVRWEIRPWRDGGGEIGGIIIFSEVITERKRAEEALAASEARCRALIEQAPEAILLYDLDERRLVDCNRKAELLFACERDELLRGGPERFYAPGQPDGLAVERSFEEHNAQAEQAQAVTFERRLRSATGLEVLCEVTLVPLPSASGRLIRASMVDITGRKRAEEALREQEARYRGLVEQDISGVVVVQGDGRIAYVNPRFARMVGCASEDLIGEPLLDIVPEEEKPQVMEAVGRQLSGQAPVVRIVSTLRTRTGEVRNILVNASRSLYQGQPASVAVVLDITEEKRKEASERELANRLRAIIDSADEAIIGKTLDGIVTTWNPAAERIFGYSASEMIGQHIVRLAVPGHEGEMAGILERIRRGERVEHYETRRRRKDGAIVEVSLTVSPIHDALGNVVGASKMARDITEAKRRETSERELANRLRAIVESSDEAIFSETLECIVTTWNAAAERIFGYSADEMVGRHSGRIAPFESDWEMAEIAAKIKRGEPIRQHEAKRRRKDGAIIDVALTASPIHDALGNIVGISKMVNDITEAKSKEAAERELAERLRALIDSSDDAIFIRDLDGVITTWNRAAERIFGYAADEVIGRHNSMFAAPGYEADFVENTARIRRGERIAHHETRRRCKDGRIIDVVLAVTPIYDAKGNLVAASTTARDVTVERAAQAAVRYQEQLYRATYQQAPVGIAFVDREYRYIHVNETLAAYMGTTTEALVGRRVIDIVPEIWDTIEPAMRRAMESGQPVHNLEVAGNTRTAGGLPRQELASYQPVVIDGETLGLSVTVVDITERRAAEAERNRLQEHLTRVQRVTKVGSVEVDLRNGRVIWSDELYDWCGLVPQSQPPAPELLIERVHPDDRAAVLDRFRRGRSGEAIEPHEYRFRDASGRWRWHYRQTEIIRDAEGRPVTALAMIYDITDRKEAELARLKSEERYRLTFDHAPVGIAHVDVEGCYRLVNETFCAMLGYRRDELLGMNFRRITHPDDVAQSNRMTDDALAGRSDVISWEKRYIRKDGSTIWCHLTSRLAEGDTEAVFIATCNDITERKKAEAERYRIQDHLKRVQRIARIGSVEADRRTGAITWSDEVFDMYGLDPRDGVPSIETILEHIHPDDRARMVEEWRRGREGEIAEPSEYRIINPDGSVRWHYRKSDHLRDEDGQVVGMIAVSYEITERKEAELARAKSEERYRLTFDQAPIGIAHVDVGGNYGMINDTLCKMLGYAREELLGRNFRAFTHPDELAKSNERARRALDGHIDAAPWETRYLRKDGSTIWCQIMGKQASGDQSGESIFIATYNDVTERKEAELARLATEERYRLTFDQAPIGIAHKDMDGRYMLVNDTLCQMVGYRRDELLGMDFRDLSPPEDVAETTGLIQRLERGEIEMIAHERRYVRKDGATIWCQVHSRVATSHNGVGRMFITTCNDITDRKKAEQRRREVEAQLRQAQKMEAVGQLTGGVAHDFNNILAIIMGNLDFAREIGEADPSLVRHIDKALSASRRGADLTHRLLAFSRRQPLEPVSIDVNKRIGELVPMLGRILGENIDLSKTLAEAPWNVEIDPSQFDSAILNLAVNSRDAMPSGGTLTITTENVTVDEAYVAQRPGLAAGDYVRVSVSDTGMGMTDEVLQKAFDPFFTTKGLGKGTGLGLSMVYGFVKQSGGHAAIYSEEGVGTTVTLLLPANEEARARQVAAVEAPPIRGGHENVLVVEDDPDVRIVTVTFLNRLGYVTIEAGDAREGLRLLEENPGIDLVLTDVILPGGEDGGDLARHARALRPGIKILFLSGYTEDVIMTNGRLGKSVVLLRKPFNQRELAEKVRIVLDGKT